MLNAADLAFIQAQLAAIAPSTEQPITYQTWAGTAGGDATLGVPPIELPRVEIGTTAIVNIFTDQEVQLASGVFEIGDLTFGVRRDAVDARDRIVYQGQTWRIVEIYPAILVGQVLTWWLRCKRA